MERKSNRLPVLPPAIWLLLAMGCSMPAKAGIVVTSGTTMNITSGTTMNVIGDFVNQNSEESNLGSGTLLLNGTSLQTVSGQNIVGGLTVNNASGVILSGNTTVNTTLTLTSGLVTLGTSNLLLGTAATVGGSPSASAMVVATGNGEFRKSFSSAGSFTYPVGDNTGTAEYSPVTLTLTSGTLATGAFVGVTLVNAKIDDPTITGSYLSRSWRITQTGISGFTSDAVFQYVPADVTGDEASIYCLRVLPAPIEVFSSANSSLHQLSASGLTSFGTFTGAAGNLLNLTVFLEGPYNGISMYTTLNTSGFLPSAQPYNVVPWSYTGTESVSSIPADIVDWVLVELRDAATPETALPETKLSGWPRAFFLKSDGSVVDLNGTTVPYIGNPVVSHNLYVIVRHRNHIDIMSSSGMTPTTGLTYEYNFSTAVTQAYNGTAGYKVLPGGTVCGMVAGDADGDGNISVLDFSKWATDFGKTSIYLSSDIDMDKEVSVLDFSKWATNFGLANMSPLKKTAIGEKDHSYRSQVPGDK